MIYLYTPRLAHESAINMKIGFLNTGFPKITLAFVLVIIIVIANVCFNYYIIRKNKATIQEMTEVINPYIESLEEFNLMVTESKMYATNWVYLQNNVDDKKSLDSLHKKRYPKLKKRLDEFIIAFHNNKDSRQLVSDSLVEVFVKFYRLIGIEKEIMRTLVSFDDYENPAKKFLCEELVESEVLPRTDSIMKKLNSIIRSNRETAVAMKAEIEKDSSRMTTIMMAASFGLLVFILMAVFFISNGIREPVLRMKSIVQQLGRGELPEEKIEAKKNVIGDMVSSVNALSDSFAQTSTFANEIGKGNLNVHYDKLSDNDLLGNALINMRNSLRSYSEDMEQQVKERTHEVIIKGRKLEIAYKEIRDSINYAKRIQESILPGNEMVTHVFKNSFIFYKPKDVVCGDFYWFGQQGDEAVIAAIDCTGHGVPGALMTVIGNSLLNQIVTSGGITSPSNILTQLDKKLHETLKQHGNIITNDGMDAAVVRYKLSKNEVTFAGAKRPLYLFKKGELIEIKGDKSPIGSFGHNLHKRFSEHRISMNTGDTLYMFSDGVQDQFGGDNGKKFMIKQFRDLLTNIQDLPMPQQATRIEKEMHEWQRDYEQTDDMLLIGIRF
ncbi:MAG: SpoIIE family protein phosphatase [Bacteroidetes bacterium]|nr:SpoIIE family protein phosphatase [Bacteroidota bacterium]